MQRPQRQLVLHKADQTYVFRCDRGQEEELLEAVIDQVRDGRTGLDWFDASLLGLKLTRAGCPHLTS